MLKKTNCEGLTWDEWACAAGLERPPMEIVMPWPEYEHWERGVDPTEIRAEKKENTANGEAR